MYSPNGQFGLNMYNSFFPSDMGGPFGYQGYPLPSPYAFPATHSYGKRKYRKKISKKGTDFADNLKEKFNDFVDSVSDNFSYAKEEATELYENGRQKVSNVKAEVSKSLS